MSSKKEGEDNQYNLDVKVPNIINGQKLVFRVERNQNQDVNLSKSEEVIRKRQQKVS